MPRLARLDAPGVLHHVIIRGIERRWIFRDDEDRDRLLARLEELLPESKTTCYAWALLSNHAHFLFRTGTMPLSTLMRRLLTGYAVKFNRRHRRHGPLFQNRYKSIVCQEEIYLKELVRYIHLNPLRAKLVSGIPELNTYPYGGHSVLMGRRECSWQDQGYVLGYFGRTVGEGRRHYLQYVEAGVEQGRRPELVGGGLIRSLGGWEEVRKIRITGQDRMKGDERILGEGDFVQEILAETGERYERHYRLKSMGYDLDTVEKRVCEIYRIGPEELYSKSRTKVRADARGLFCYWAARDLNHSLTELAKRLHMTQPGVGYAVMRGEKIAKKDGLQLAE